MKLDFVSIAGLKRHLACFWIPLTYEIKLQISRNFLGSFYCLHCYVFRKIYNTSIISRIKNTKKNRKKNCFTTLMRFRWNSVYSCYSAEQIYIPVIPWTKCLRRFCYDKFLPLSIVTWVLTTSVPPPSYCIPDSYYFALPCYLWFHLLFYISATFLAEFLFRL